MIIDPAELLAVFVWLDAYYRSNEGLARPNGLAVNERPDFEAVAAWIFDVYLSSRLANLDADSSKRNVVHAIQQTDEWRARHPNPAGLAVMRVPYIPRFNLDRREFLQTMNRLDLFYKSWAGLQRPNGLSKNGQPDFEAIAQWVFGVYLNRRLNAQSPEQSWDSVVAAIRTSDEWRSKAPTRQPVDASTLTGKHLAGYQGWFSTPNDGQNRGWDHWFRGTPGNNAVFDLWPETSELFDSELTPTGLTLRNGEPARLYSCRNQRTVNRHFEWMADAGIDGVSIGRFVDGTRDAATRDRLDGVLDRVRRAAENAGRVFFVWYDVTACPAGSFVDDVKRDWTYLREHLHVHQSSSYLRHRGKPIVGVWAAGAASCPQSPNDWVTLIDWLKVQPSGGATVLVSSIRDWRTNATWRPIMDRADIVAPWAITGCFDEPSADGFRTGVVEPDLAYTRARGQDYLPLIFPGFSWHNLQSQQQPMNSTPRRGGRFYWRQAYNVIDAGATCLFTAMFDEVDEGTACYKVATTQSGVPTQGNFLTLDADGEQLPSDWYLRLAGAAGRMLRREIPLSPALPIRP